MKKHYLIILILFLFFQLVSPSLSQVNETFYLSADSLKENESIRVDGNWRYHSGDNPEWAGPEYDDSSWEMTETSLSPNRLPESGWQGIGWFRKHISIDSALWAEPLVVSMRQAGSSEIYFDGKLVLRAGRDGIPIEDIFRIPDPSGEIFSFLPKTDHVISVRYSNHSPQRFKGTSFPAGFVMAIHFAGPSVKQHIDETTENLSNQMFFAAMALAFGLLHLILFLFSPGSKTHLYFSIFLFFWAANTFFDYQNFLADGFNHELFYLRIHRTVVIFVNIFQLRFIYSLFRSKLPKQFWIISSGLLVFGVIAVLKPVEYYIYFVRFTLVATFEIFRVIVLAIRGKKEGSWIIATGFLFLFFFGLYDGLVDLRLMSMINEMENGYMYGMVGLFICMSVYLARDFAKRNEKILEQERRAKEMEIERRLLEAEDARKSKELEEARLLQLSMLPECAGDIPGLDICLHMETATEVGGDYYDYHLADDGTLTVVFGDATGHGMKAGIMVSVIKSLFVADASRTDIRSFFRECSQTIRQMRLGNLYMALAMVKIKNRKMVVSSAGMPPILIYRSKTQSIEEIVIKGIPLGGSDSFSYKQEKTKLAPGDTVLLMSDGFPELFNDKNEMLDYLRVKEIFKEAAEKSPNEIVEHLSDAGKIWRGDRPQNDDVTFVVLKVKHE